MKCMYGLYERPLTMPELLSPKGRQECWSYSCSSIVSPTHPQTLTTSTALCLPVWCVSWGWSRTELVTLGSSVVHLRVPVCLRKNKGVGILDFTYHTGKTAFELIWFFFSFHILLEICTLLWISRIFPQTFSQARVIRLYLVSFAWSHINLICISLFSWLENPGCLESLTFF